MLKNMKVKHSLIAGFGFTIAVSLAIIISSIVVMLSLSNGYNDLIDRHVRANVLITTIRLESNIAARNIRDIALIPDDPKNPQLEAQATECLEKMKQDINELQRVYPMDVSNLNDYISAAQAWMDVAPDIIDEVNAGRVQNAIDMIQFTCTPALEEMTSLAQSVDDGIVAAQDEAVADQQSLVNICSLIFVVATVLATAVVIFMIRVLLSSILPPVSEVQEALLGFSKGDFTIPVTYESRNELGDMCYAMRKSQKILSEVVEDECYLMTEFAGGNFGARTRAEKYYVGRLKDVLMAMREMTVDVSNTVLQIVESADQLDAGSNQVSDGAQALSQGATEQAAATEELSGAIEEINHDIQACYDKAIEAKNITDEAGRQMIEATEQMNQMLTAMDEINNSSQEISKIIKTIEDIAFQTNILALNAAVEAARAGAAGKGFAVVADEVRSLAAKSAEASKNTSDLIESSIAAVAKGVKLAQGTAAQMNVVSECASQTMGHIVEVSELSERQARAMEQINQNVGQIAAVVAANSATAEESAAASEELSGQASILRDLTRHFALRDMRENIASAVVTQKAPAFTAPAAPAAMNNSKY